MTNESEEERPEEDEEILRKLNPMELEDGDILIRRTDDFVESTAQAGVTVTNLANENIFIDFLTFDGMVRATKDGAATGIYGTAKTDVRVNLSPQVAMALHSALGERLKDMGYDMEEGPTDDEEEVN